MTAWFYCHYPPVSFCHHSPVFVMLPCFSRCPSIVSYLRDELCVSRSLWNKQSRAIMVTMDHQIRIKQSLWPDIRKSHQSFKSSWSPTVQMKVRQKKKKKQNLFFPHRKVFLFPLCSSFKITEFSHTIPVFLFLYMLFRSSLRNQTAQRWHIWSLLMANTVSQYAGRVQAEIQTHTWSNAMHACHKAFTVQ